MGYYNVDEEQTPDAVLGVSVYNPISLKDPVRSVEISIDSDTRINEVIAPVLDFLISGVGISEEIVFKYLQAIAGNNIVSIAELKEIPEMIEGIDKDGFLDFKEKLKDPKFIWYLYKIYKDDLEGR